MAGFSPNSRKPFSAADSPRSPTFASPSTSTADDARGSHRVASVLKYLRSPRERQRRNQLPPISTSNSVIGDSRLNISASPLSERPSISPGSVSPSNSPAERLPVYRPSLHPQSDAWGSGIGGYNISSAEAGPTDWQDISGPTDISRLGLTYGERIQAASHALRSLHQSGAGAGTVTPHGHGRNRNQNPSSARDRTPTPSSPTTPLTETREDTPAAMTWNIHQGQESVGDEAGPNSHTSGATAGVPPPTQNLSAGPTNLSGLVCNVHRTTGQEPHSLVGATTTVLGDKLYVFGGRLLSKSRPELTSDLHELDLIRRHWTKLQTSGDVPPPRYFHSVCALGDTKLVCYGGMSPVSAVRGQNAGAAQSQNSQQDSQPEVVVMSDVHILDVPTRTWTCIQTSNTPQGRYAHCAAILPSSAVFTSSNAPLSAIHNNPPSSNPHQGKIGVEIDGFGGSEMVVVGGQDSSNHYIEQISVFNLRNLRWTSTSPLGRSCGAYRSVVAPLTGVPVSQIGAGVGPGTGAGEDDNSPDSSSEAQPQGPAMLIYSNYNFLDVKLELQVRLADGQLVEKEMSPHISPPGLRFPNGGVINGHFVVSGTYLTSSKQEYALWALDLKTLTWGRIDVGGSIFNHGSWNRGVLWNRKSTFVILGHRKRSLVEDYNHRRLNFSHICFVELEAFGLHDNPRKSSPTSDYASVSAPAIPASLHTKFAQHSAGGRPYSARAAEQLGLMAQAFPELSDMELLTIGGERIPVSSHILARRWGPYFIQLLREATAVAGDNINNSNSSSAGGGGAPDDVATMRQLANAPYSRNSSITITPASQPGAGQYSTSQSSTLGGNLAASSSPSDRRRGPEALPNFEMPSAHSLPPNSRPRTLYLPHTYLTVQLLVHFLYTSSLPALGSPLCTPQILCSLLQLARPYQIDGLLEATVERLHQVLDGRNAAAVFNAAAMAAGGGRGTGFLAGPGGTLDVLNGAAAAAKSSDSLAATTAAAAAEQSSDDNAGKSSAQSDSNSSPDTGRRRPSAQRPANLRINTNVNAGGKGGNKGGSNLGGNGRRQRDRAESVDSTSTATSTSTSTDTSLPDESVAAPSSSLQPRQNRSQSQSQSRERGRQSSRDDRPWATRSRDEREVWTGDVSSVVGLQKRGLRGLMEGRRMRERGGTGTGGGGGNGGDERSSGGSTGPNAAAVGVGTGNPGG